MSALSNSASQSINALVLAGEGLNCELETQRALGMAEIKANIIQVHELVDDPEQILQVDCLVIPGGFSYADDLGSGHILGEKLRLSIGPHLPAFLAQKKLILGICNGFQVLLKLNLLPFPGRSLSKHIRLSENRSKSFINRWENMHVINRDQSIWLKNLPEQFMMPIRHAEGRIEMSDDCQQALINENISYLQYCDDPNGSQLKIAGIESSCGQVLGLMPHPEACIIPEQFPYATHPQSQTTPMNVGIQLFQNAYQYLYDLKGRKDERPARN
jgi:phosphoribosylformylglycinamidine synthase